MNPIVRFAILLVVAVGTPSLLRATDVSNASSQDTVEVPRKRPPPERVTSVTILLKEAAQRSNDRDRPRRKDATEPPLKPIYLQQDQLDVLSKWTGIEFIAIVSGAPGIHPLGFKEPLNYAEASKLCDRLREHCWVTSCAYDAYGVREHAVR